MNPGLIKTYEAGAAVNPARIVKFGAADYEVIQATGDAAAMLGVVVETGVETSQAYADGDRIDVIRDGLANVVLGDTVTRGAWLTSDANGKAVAASIAAGTEVHCIGRAEISGVAGDIIPVYVQPVVIATDVGIIIADVTISTGELLALNATEKTLIAAPGAGKVLVPELIQFHYDFATTAYAGIAAGEDINIRYTDSSGVIVATLEVTGFLDGTADEYRTLRPLADAAKEPAANAALVAHMASGEITTGDSPLKCRIFYRELAVTW
jgi:hypothetical protein